MRGTATAIVATAAATCVALGGIGLGTPAASGATHPMATPTSEPFARRWMEATMDRVRSHRPNPPATARIYAYVAVTYRDTRAGSNAKQANEATRQIARQLFDDDAIAVDTFARSLDPNVPRLSARAAAVVARMQRRLASDGYRPDNPAVDMQGAPPGDGHWVKRTPKGPFAVTAGSWKRWLVPQHDELSVPAPPAFGSARYQAQLQRVRNFVARRDAAWVAKINFWGGTPGTEGPSGIWQNVLWSETGTSSLAANDQRYAQVQAVLAEAIADAFMECWKVKYVYWTARPDMVDPTIKTAMDDPPFPGYVSGHSTISAAAARVLGSLVPAKKRLWMTDAETARDSRLYAGIHFDVDNQVGFKLGLHVGDLALARAKELR